VSLRSGLSRSTAGSLTGLINDFAVNGLVAGNTAGFDGDRTGCMIVISLLFPVTCPRYDNTAVATLEGILSIRDGGGSALEAPRALHATSRRMYLGALTHKMVVGYTHLWYST
jgi:hypothetical protein